MKVEWASGTEWEGWELIDSENFPAARCPLCKGSGVYYFKLSNGTGGTKCHGCDGKGWVR